MEIFFLSFEESSQKEQGSSPLSDLDWKRMVESRFAKIKMKWSIPFVDIEANNSILVADL